MDKEEFLSDEEYEAQQHEKEKLRRRCEQIIKRYFNPNGITLTDEEYRDIASRIRRGEEVTSFQQKAQIYAYEVIKEMFLDGDISCEFEDALQYSYIFMQQINIDSIASSKAKLKSFGTALRKSFQKEFDKIEKDRIESREQRVPLTSDCMPTDPMDEILKRSKGRALAKACSTLQERERHVLGEVYGLGKTRVEVGQEIGATPDQVTQIRDKALKKLRHPIRSRGIRDYIEV